MKVIKGNQVLEITKEWSQCNIYAGDVTRCPGALRSLFEKFSESLYVVVVQVERRACYSCLFWLNANLEKIKRNQKQIKPQSEADASFSSSVNSVQVLYRAQNKSHVTRGDAERQKRVHIINLPTDVTDYVIAYAFRACKPSIFGLRALTLGRLSDSCIYVHTFLMMSQHSL